MSGARLAAKVLVSGLMRMAEAAGGFPAILAKGDETAGAILLLMREKGRFFGLYERTLAGSASYGWQRTGPQNLEDGEALNHHIQKLRSRDPDLWIVELDIPDAERFILDSA